MGDGVVDVLQLRAAGVGLVLDCAGPGLPRVLHWGADLGPLTPAELTDLARTVQPQRLTNSTDEATTISLVPEPSAGWMGTPGLAGYRSGAAFSPRFVVESAAATGSAQDQGGLVTVFARDPEAGLELEIRIGLDDSGLVRAQAAVTNAADRPYTVDRLVVALPLPAEAVTLLDFAGRHLRERSPQLAPFTIGTHLRENRRGRTGHDTGPLTVAAEQGFGFRSGQVWALHVGWSGNHVTLAERTAEGMCILAGGELLLPGEMRLEPGETYRTPWIFGSYGVGLDTMSARFHTLLRRGPARRPVTLNTWEAVYFDHDAEHLIRLARTAAAVGVERFVLDDGWFRGRFSDVAGLGDWYVDEHTWPQGLHPLVDAVTGLGMEFGLWVEPEMINPDSDLARSHPDWILAPAGRMPPLSRTQQVLDLTRQDAYDYILKRLDALIGEYRIGYLKWDHNRDLMEPGSGEPRTPAVHAQTLAVYRLIDEIRSRHPDLQIESCSAGGGRVDAEILSRTDRIHPSDCQDAVERQQIQRWTGLLVPPEMMGCHVSSPVSHTTGRQLDLDFRCGTAFLGHFGIEWDLTAATEGELDRLAEWIAVHKSIRELMATATVVHADHPDPAVLVGGLVAADRSRGIYTVAQVVTSVQSALGQVRLPGLDPDARYRVSPLPPGDVAAGPVHSELPWWTRPLVLSGRVLETVGLRAPTLFPERLVLLEAVRV